MKKINDQEKRQEIERNILFVSTIYDSFEALEETLGRLKLEEPLFIIHAAKKAFAREIFKYAEKNPPITFQPSKKATRKLSLN